MKPITLGTPPPGDRTQSTDCSIESDLLQFELLRRWSPTRRLMQAASLMRSARQLSLNAHRQRFPQLCRSELGQRLAQAWLQEYCPSKYMPTGTEMTWIKDSIQLAAELHDLFVVNGISYYVRGGVAAVAYGETRTTQNLDVVLAIDLADLPRIATIFETAGFYISGLDDVIAQRMSSFQVTQIKFPKSCGTIRRWMGEIISYFDNRTTQGVVEGINNKLKLIKRMGYGFRNFDNFRLRVALIWHFNH
jgi:Transposase